MQNPYSPPRSKLAAAANSFGKRLGALLVLAWLIFVTALGFLGTIFSAVALATPDKDQAPSIVPPTDGQLWLQLTLWVILLAFGVWRIVGWRSRWWL
ncbi:hypothetical protein [Pseudomonas sp. Hp2]|uniref:hypothetical protein n=1 Tax=Pseudomonas sp. Hp2 TaxID=701189 RepID=UPI00112BCF24|nr:hypothetical protein [Pseudomonas sp. Hp2]